MRYTPPRTKRSRIMVSAPFQRVSISRQYRGRVIIFRWASSGGRAHLNVNYRLLPRAFPSRVDQGPKDIRRILRVLWPNPPRRERAGRSLFRPGSVLGRGVVFQFATSFAPLSVQSRARSALSPEPDIEVSAIDFSELLAKLLASGNVNNNALTHLNLYSDANWRYAFADDIEVASA